MAQVLSVSGISAEKLPLRVHLQRIFWANYHRGDMEVLRDRRRHPDIFQSRKSESVNRECQPSFPTCHSNKSVILVSNTLTFPQTTIHRDLRLALQVQNANGAVD